MKVKVGDKVKILAGKDKGKEGTVTTTLRKKDKVVVSGINIVKKHMKPNAMNHQSTFQTFLLSKVHRLKLQKKKQNQKKKQVISNE